MNRVSPERTTPATRSTAPPTVERAFCPVCEKALCTIVTTGQPRRDERLDAQVLDQAFYCDHCDAWHQYIRAWDPMRKRPTGRIIGRPRRITDSKRIDALLKQYPEATGVEP